MKNNLKGEIKSKSNWDAANIPDQKGRVVIITGATSGLGQEAARVLAGENASVIMAVRNVEIGPSNFFEMHGHPVKVKSNRRSHDEQAARRLWELSEKLTGVEYQE